MAAKKPLWRSTTHMILSLIMVLACAIVLVPLQHFCMRAGNNAFVDDYCLSDNNMRAVLAAIITVATMGLSALLTAAVCAFRTSRLQGGIQEGVYIALATASAGTGLAYCRKALRTNYFLIICLVMATYGGLQTMQTLLTQSVHTADVYVRTPGSTATVFDAISTYDVPDASSPPTLLAAMDLLATLAEYSSGSSSELLPGGVVSTKVVRNGFVTASNITGGDATNAFLHQEVVANISTTCPDNAKGNVSLSELLTNSSVSLIADDSSMSIFAAYIYDLAVAQTTPSSIVFETNSTLVKCEPCVFPVTTDTVVDAVRSTCTSTLSLATEDIIYTLVSRSLETINTVNNNTTVDTTVLAQLMQNYSIAVESAASAITDDSVNSQYQQGGLNAFGNFPQGLFNFSMNNVVHSRLTAAASLGLDFLWLDAGASTDSPIGANDFYQHDVAKPVYHRVVQPYAPAPVILGFALSIAIAALLLCAVGIYSTYTSPINIKPCLDNALLDNIDVCSVEHRRLQVPGACNDEELQCKLAFGPERMLYCRLWQAGARTTVCIGHNPCLPLLNKVDDYD